MDIPTILVSCTYVFPRGGVPVLVSIQTILWIGTSSGGHSIIILGVQNIFPFYLFIYNHV
jgi:hypothetical protein